MGTSEKSIFELDEFKPLADEWNARAEVFRNREAYYDGTVYNAALNGLAWLRPRASAKIWPLSRAVNVDAGIIPGAVHCTLCWVA